MSERADTNGTIEKSAGRERKQLDEAGFALSPAGKA